MIMYDCSMTKAIIKMSLLAGFLWCATPASAGESFGRCLPSGTDLNNTVAIEANPRTTSATAKTTVKQRLVQLKARCKKGKLVDGKGRQIYLYSLVGCWGNPPADYLEQIQHQEQEIQRLKKKYTVIQIPCGQGVDPRMISQHSPGAGDDPNDRVPSTQFICLY